jgi:hypothetical protein
MAANISPEARERIRAGARKGGATRGAQMRAKGQRFFPTKLPPISEAEAQRLIADAIAAGKVTVCPPAATIERPNNAGAGW